ncbi:ribosomal protein S5 domain 2-type protein [Kockiozyma suomiensis]|uniref:ribosomal protein S5 domain 2-type protein n=1 Tax=Kockiozyma suomiensis TaxID=1337062 RepID=UPI003343E735
MAPSFDFKPQSGINGSSKAVPVVDSLSQIYSVSDIPHQQQRWQRLRDKFAELYPGEEISFIARSPGRVNLIGEHIDYSLFDVLPMAIAQDVLIAVHVGSADNKLRLANTSPRFPIKEFAIEALQEINIDSSVLEWTNYFLSGIKGAFAVSGNVQIPSMHCLIDGSVPTGGGLSSSAAFVSASLLSVVAAVKSAASAPLTAAITKADLVSAAIIAERNVGVNSGGMDQAASVFGVAGHALRVQFAPELKPIEVAFRGDTFAFVIANTLVVADKQVTGPIHYNLRVVETTLSAEIMAKVCCLGKLPVRDGFGGTWRGVYDKFAEQNIDMDGIISRTKQVFDKEEGYTLSEAALLMEMSEAEIKQKYMSRFPVRFERLQFRKRAIHVLEEAKRVEKFCSILDLTELDDEDYYSALGQIMKDSHESCKSLYECSCDELNQITSLAIKSGAYGSRLTGAGWGGSTISLVSKDRVSSLVQTLKDEYYCKRWPKLSEAELKEAICITEPGLGSVIFA